MYGFKDNGYNVYLTKAKNREFSMFTKNTQIQILSKISDMPKIRSIVYRPDIHDLQTSIVSFADYEKFLEKVDDG